MALPGLLAALKIVPWADVISAAPGIVKGARKMFRRTEEEVQAAATAPPADDADPVQRMRALEIRVHELAEGQKAAAAIVEALAEQNAAVVGALAVLRVRQRALWTVVAVLAVGWAGTVLALSYGAFGTR